MAPPVLVFSSGALRLDRRGRFFYGEQEVSHPRVLRMLRIGLTDLGGGRYGYRLGPRTVEVLVEDAPFHVVGLREDGGLFAMLTNEAEAPICAERLIYRGDVPYLGLEGGAEACFLPSAALALSSFLGFDEDGGCFLELGSSREPIKTC